MCWRYWRPLPETQFASRAAKRFVRKLLPTKSIRISFLGHLFIYLHRTGYSGISSLLSGDDFHWWGQRHLPVTPHTFISIRPHPPVALPVVWFPNFTFASKISQPLPRKGLGDLPGEPLVTRHIFSCPHHLWGQGISTPSLQPTCSSIPEWSREQFWVLGPFSFQLLMVSFNHTHSNSCPGILVLEPCRTCLGNNWRSKKGIQLEFGGQLNYLVQVTFSLNTFLSLWGHRLVNITIILENSVSQFCLNALPSKGKTKSHAFIIIFLLNMQVEGRH